MGTWLVLVRVAGTLGIMVGGRGSVLAAWGGVTVCGGGGEEVIKGKDFYWREKNSSTEFG